MPILKLVIDNNPMQGDFMANPNVRFNQASQTYLKIVNDYPTLYQPIYKKEEIHKIKACAADAASLIFDDLAKRTQQAYNTITPEQRKVAPIFSTLIERIESNFKDELEHDSTLLTALNEVEHRIEQADPNIGMIPIVAEKWFVANRLDNPLITIHNDDFLRVLTLVHSVAFPKFNFTAIIAKASEEK